MDSSSLSWNPKERCLFVFGLRFFFVFCVDVIVFCYHAYFDDWNPAGFKLLAVLELGDSCRGSHVGVLALFKSLGIAS